NKLLFSAIGGVIGYILPGVWLGSKISQRQDEVIKALPDALDLLVICVEAGLGFEGAMAKVAEKWDNELSRAFARVLQEIRLGKLRIEALREMDKNLGVAEVTSFVAAIIQATQFGVSIAKVLRIQSEQMRIQRRQRAEKKAQEAPIKMLFPMVFLIFPSLFIVLLGPAVLQILDSGVFGSVF
ncbi:MAG: type II secretion system F family protein, partial [Saprospiraceae bacterium]